MTFPLPPLHSASSGPCGALLESVTTSGAASNGPRRGNPVRRCGGRAGCQTYTRRRRSKPRNSRVPGRDSLGRRASLQFPRPHGTAAKAQAPSPPAAGNNGLPAGVFAEQTSNIARGMPERPAESRSSTDRSPDIARCPAARVQQNPAFRAPLAEGRRQGRRLTPGRHNRGAFARLPCGCRSRVPPYIMSASGATRWRPVGRKTGRCRTRSTTR